jgi:hypothetical protein
MIYNRGSGKEDDVLHFHAYIEQEINHLNNENPSPAEQHREQWLRWREQNRIARGRAMLRWTGDRLVGSGERLRAWSGVDSRTTDGIPGTLSGAGTRRC